MDQQLTEIRDKQRESWNKFSSGWERWDELTMDFLAPIGDEIINLLGPKNGDVVLDVASGTGEPGLSIAPLVKPGRVIATDLSEDMLNIARENARQRGVDNIEFRTADVCELPFADQSFDAISCRFGFMFFPDMLTAARELQRVLKPGGRLAVSVWGIPENNFWVTAISQSIKKNMDLPKPPPDAPGMFRCAEPQMLQNLFREAGLQNTLEKEVSCVLQSGTANVYWDMMTEVAAPFAKALSEADEFLKEKIKKEAFETVHARYPRDKVALEAQALVIYGEK